MERVMVLRAIIDGLIERMGAGGDADGNKDTLNKRNEFIHSNGIATCARLLALKRGLDPELAAIAGHILNIGWIVHQVRDAVTQSTLGALEAERILRKTGRFSESEISTICGSIRSQNSFGLIGTPFEELLKDAVIIEMYLHDPDCRLDNNQMNRLGMILAQFGIA
jgi:uncharacterized protein